MRKTVTVKDWTTKAGLRAVILLVNDGSHHCGYVEINEGHPLFNKEYTEKCCPQLPEGETIGRRGVIPLLCADMSAKLISADVYFNVHGGITFSGEFKNESKGWWFGYDCAHAGDKMKLPSLASFGDFDGDVWRDEAFCIAECEDLARQLAELK